jgi:hypothetical protein
MASKLNDIQIKSLTAVTEKSESEIIDWFKEFIVKNIKHRMPELKFYI